MAEINESVLWECNSDLNDDVQITSADAILLKALILFTDSSTSKSFSEYYTDLVSNGTVPSLDLTSVNTDIFERIPSCFDFNFLNGTEECDVEILDAFGAYLKSENKTDLNTNDSNNFLLFLRSLKVQGILGCDISAYENIMLPTISSQDKIYFTNGSWIPKVPPNTIGYDESNSTKGTLIDSSEEKFLISDPSVKVYYEWDGESSPRSWRTLGLCKVYKRNNDTLDDEYGVIHPPVDVIASKSLPASDMIPMGTPNIFNGKTIAIDGEYVAISWHYQATGVIYIYKETETGVYTNIHEIVVDDYDFSQGLPVIELKGTELFITNPQMSGESIIIICDFNGVSDYTINLDDDSVSILSAPSGPTSVVGFGSCMKINDEQTKLFIGHPKQERKLNWQIDQYTIEETDIFAGAAYTYTKSGGVWSHSETIYPDLSDYENRSLASDLDIQFGYDIDYANNNLFISSPRSFNISADRREGSVHRYNYASTNMTSVILEQFNSSASTSNYTFIETIEYSDSRFDTSEISTGNWNFGTSTICNSDATKIFILHNIPTQGTFVSYYSKVTNEFVLGTNFYYNISDQILGGTLAISDSNSTKAFATNNLVKVLV